MHLTLCPRAQRRGYVLLAVLFIVAVGLAVFAGVYQWTNQTSIINDRNNVYNGALAAAEAGSERALSYINRDFLNQTFTPNKTNFYSTLVPTNPWASDFRFTDGKGNPNRLSIASSTTTVRTNLESQFAGLYGLVYTMNITSQAKPLDCNYDMTAAVRQDLQLASIPVFQFAIFYSMDLELNPGALMKITGKVHGNSSIYAAPSVGLEFLDDVTAVSRIYHNRHPLDPNANPNPKVNPVYRKENMENVSSLTLPIGTNNTPDAVREILNLPPAGEIAASPMGQQRYYNQCDLIVCTSGTNIIVTAGAWKSFASIAPDVVPSTGAPYYSFVNSTASFYDAREKKWTQTTEIDVAKLKTWLNNGGSSLNFSAQYDMGHNLNSIYVYDTRAPGTKLPAVRVVNGRDLPPSGLTVATALPLYVKGHFNAPNITPGSTDTSSTKPASLVGDAITILSASWSDACSSTLMNDASDTTVNAAFLAGIVPTGLYSGTKRYSGGVENFPRLLEDWGGRTLTYNGSMVVLYPSRYATGFWMQTGNYYQAAVRKWAFDINFLNYDRLPPATPQMRKLVRGQWRIVSAQ